MIEYSWSYWKIWHSLYSTLSTRQVEDTLAGAGFDPGSQYEEWRRFATYMGRHLLQQSTSPSNGDSLSNAPSNGDSLSNADLVEHWDLVSPGGWGGGGGGQRIVSEDSPGIPCAKSTLTPLGLEPDIPSEGSPIQKGPICADTSTSKCPADTAKIAVRELYNHWNDWVGNDGHYSSQTVASTIVDVLNALNTKIPGVNDDTVTPDTVTSNCADSSKKLSYEDLLARVQQLQEGNASIIKTAAIIAEHNLELRGQLGEWRCPNCGQPCYYTRQGECICDHCDLEDGDKP